MFMLCGCQNHTVYTYYKSKLLALYCSDDVKIRKICCVVIEKSLILCPQVILYSVLKLVSFVK